MKSRDIYLNKLIEFKDKPLIKVITGIRRCGKSTLLDLFEEYLLTNDVDKEDIIGEVIKIIFPRYRSKELN